MNQQERDEMREMYEADLKVHQPDGRGFCVACHERYRPCDVAWAAGDVIKVLDAWEEVMPTDATSNTNPLQNTHLRGKAQSNQALSARKSNERSRA